MTHGKICAHLEEIYGGEGVEGDDPDHGSGDGGHGGVAEPPFPRHDQIVTFRGGPVIPIWPTTATSMPATRTFPAGWLVEWPSDEEDGRMPEEFGDLGPRLRVGNLYPI